MKKTFKQFLNEHTGMQILNAFNNDVETIFGHKKSDFNEETPPDDKSDEIKTVLKLNKYMSIIKNTDE